MPPSAERRVETTPGAVVLVEGRSDAAALDALAARRGVDLTAAGVVVQAMGGATNVAAHVERFGPHGLDVRLAGLYDVAEERFFRRGLERGGLGSDGLAKTGFFPLRPDLEGELVAALGPERCEAVIRSEGDGAAWDLFRRQPFQRDRPAAAQLHRWIGSGSGRKIRYAAAFVDALDLAEVPDPLDAVLAHALA